LFDNAAISNSSKKRHGRPPATKMGLILSAPRPRIASNARFVRDFLLRPHFNCRETVVGTLFSQVLGRVDQAVVSRKKLQQKHFMGWGVMAGKYRNANSEPEDYLHI
jgi:hypothetical protein